MAPRGTGIQLPRVGDVTVQAPNVIDADRASTARSWGEIAAAGARIADTGLDYLARAEHQRQVGHLAREENEAERVRLDLEEKHRFNPKGFDEEWQAYRDGKLEQAEPWSIPHLTRALGAKGNASLRAIQHQTIARDERLDAEAVSIGITSAGNELVAAGMAGTLRGDQGRIAAQEFGAKLQAAVNARLMSPEKADFLEQERTSEAFGALAARQGVEIYKQSGKKAGYDYLTKEILENESLKMSPAMRRRAFEAGKAAIDRETQIDATEKGAVVQEAKDLTARIASGQPYDESEVRDAVANLGRVRATRDQARLVIEHGVRQATQGQDVRELARSAVQNRAATAERARTARDFFVSRGWTPVQAAGIVGNLVQESGLDPTTVHDEGTGLGIAGWRLERREALRQFASARGKPATDFQTQLEFLDQEIKTSPTEARALAELRAARTPQEAARAFIHFERPKGYTPERPEAGHGFMNRVANAISLGNGEAIDTSPFAGEITKRIQAAAVTAGRKTWADLKPQIDAGKLIEDADLDAIQTAAVLSQDQTWIKQVEDLSIAREIGRYGRNLTATERQAFRDRLVGNVSSAALDSYDKQVARMTKQITEAPVDFAVNERKIPAPDPLTFDSPDRYKAALDQRIAAARGVADDQKIAVGSPLRDVDRATIAGAIATGDPRKAAVAMKGLVGLPDDMLLPALRSSDIKSAITGAARSDNIERYNAAMTFLDQMDARAPEATHDLFGKEVTEDLKFWQKNHRFLSAEQLALERKKASDPGVAEQQKKRFNDGIAAAKEYTSAQVLGQFNNSWAQYLGFGRAQAPVETDTWTTDALMSDFQNQFARLSAKGLPQDKALEAATELLKTQWAASPVNGGRLMRNGPEKYYPQVGGTWDWMGPQIEREIGERLGTPRFGGDVMSPSTNWDYVVVADDRTAREAQQFRRDNPTGTFPSYKVMVTDRTSGRATVLDQRFTWNPGPDQQRAFENFEAERARSLATRASLSDTLLGSGPEFPDVRPPVGRTTPVF